jgi:hypothetical protein
VHRAAEAGQRATTLDHDCPVCTGEAGTLVDWLELEPVSPEEDDGVEAEVEADEAELVALWTTFVAVADTGENTATATQAARKTTTAAVAAIRRIRRIRAVRANAMGAPSRARLGEAWDRPQNVVHRIAVPHRMRP